MQDTLFHCVKPLVSKKSGSLSSVEMKNNHNMSEGLQPRNSTAALSTHKFYTNIHITTSIQLTIDKKLCAIGLHNIMVHYYKKNSSNVEYQALNRGN